ncbi:MAG: hypothetical protein WAU07_02930 [Microgenomates group bacterium]
MQQNSQPNSHQVQSDRLHTSASGTNKLTISLILLLLVCIATLVYVNTGLSNSIQDLENQIKLTESVSETNAVENIPNYDAQTVERIGECGEEVCLFRGADAVEGMGKVTGYYHTYPKTDWGGVPVICNALIVEEGSIELIENLLSWVHDGNGINMMTNEGKLILNIDLREEYETVIKSSTSTNPVTLTVVRHTPQARGVGSCSSFVSIIKAE